MKIKFLFFCFTIAFLSGCISYNKFSKRKYTPGFYWNKSKTVSIETSEGNEKIIQEENTFRKTEKFSTDYSLQDSIINSPLIQERIKNIFQKKNPDEKIIFELSNNFRSLDS